MISSGVRVHILANHRLQQPRCVARVIQVEPSIVLQVDPMDFTMAQMAVTDALSFGFGSCGMYFTCRATIKAIDGERVLLDAPEEPRKLPRRNFTRATLPWDLEVIKQGINTRCRAVNVCAGGALVVPISLDAPIDQSDVGAQVDVRIEIPGWRKVRTAARVLRLQHPEDGRIAFALQFLELDEVAENKIQLCALRATARRYLRVAVDGTCELSIEGGDQRAARIRNLSASGLLIALEGDTKAARVGALGRLALYVGEVHPLRVEIPKFSIVRVERAQNETLIGVHFSQISAEGRGQLIEFVMRRLTRV